MYICTAAFIDYGGVLNNIERIILIYKNSNLFNQ